jgi:hypothetical protein
MIIFEGYQPSNIVMLNPLREGTHSCDETVKFQEMVYVLLSGHPYSLGSAFIDPMQWIDER